MTKIVLKNIFLVNWYGFINTRIPLGENLTLITGENECGKSTILDAVKYAFSGDVEFNKSMSGKKNIGGNKRTLPSYTRCLLDASAGSYARPPEKVPNVFTHIALEYYDEINRNTFLLGVILETNASNNVAPSWYAMEEVAMERIGFVYYDGEIPKPYDSSGFQKTYGVQIMQRKEALSKFMQMTGLKFSAAEIPKFQRKLRSIMTYNPEAKIQEFIKESVLEQHDVNFGKLKEAKNNIEKITRTLEAIREELRALEAILKDFEEYEKVSFRLKINEVKTIYKELLKITAEIKKTKADIEKNDIEMGRLKKLLPEKETEKRNKETAYLSALNNLRQLDVSRAIEEERNRQTELQDLNKKLFQEKEELQAFQAQVKQMLALKADIDIDDEKRKYLDDLETKEFTAIEKEDAVNHLKKALFDLRDRLFIKGVEIKNEITSIQAEINHFNQIVAESQRNRPDYSHIREQRALIDEINREFKRRGIGQEARFVCEYVLALSDESWREAIEAFLGIHRYAILVEPQHFETANKILDGSDFKYVELINTKLLAGKEFDSVANSVFHKLIIKNEYAAKYFAFWLGRIAAVDMDDVANYENAMSKEGKLSRNMAVTFINTKKTKSFALGQEAIEINLKNAERQIERLANEKEQVLEKQRENNGLIKEIEAHQPHFRAYNYNALADFEANNRSLHESGEKLSELYEAQKNNKEFIALSTQVEVLQKQLKKLDDEILDDRNRLDRLDLENKQKLKDLSGYTLNLHNREEALEKYEYVNPTHTKIAKKEYDDFISGTAKEGDVWAPSTREQRERRQRELEGLIIGGQKAYNQRKNEEERLPEGPQHEATFRARKTQIWIDDLQSVEATMREQTRKYEAIFKNEFVLSIYETVLSAKDDIAGINKELRKLKFSTRYQFDVNLLDDKSDFGKILRYAEFLKKTNKVDDGQMFLNKLVGYEEDEVETLEEEIKDIINRMIDKNDTSVIEKHADYRNYMSYEIVINNEEITNGKLSKQAGYNSGAGTQIPYTLILSAALSMLYNEREYSTRLIFIDEPFEKMSDHNIKLMLEFFKSQNFQVIFCAPPNKTDSIGYECDTIIPVIKLRKDNMQIGSVQFHDQRD